MKKNVSQLKIGVILSYVNLIIGNLIPLFYTPIMLSILGQSEYGLYKLSSSFTSYLSLISFGLGSAITRYLIKAREEEGKEAEQKVLGLFTRIFQLISIITFIAGIGLTFCVELFYGNSLTQDELNTMRILVFLISCNTSLSFLMTPQVSVVTSHEKFVFLQLMNIATTCIIPVANLAALFLGFASIGMTVSSLAINIVVRFCYYIYMRKALKLKADYKNPPKHLIKEILMFSFWIFVANVVGQLYNATDAVMIGMIPALATIGVAVYNVGGVFNVIVSSAAQGISTLLMPKVNKMVFNKADNEELTSLAIRTGRLQGYIIVLIVTGFIAFGQPFISWYAGSEYADSYWVAILMMIPNTIPLIQSVCLSIIVAENKHRFRSIVYLGIAISNVIGTWFLMQVMGVIGAALMTGISLVIGQGFVMNWYYWKKIKLNIPRFWKENLKVFIFPAIMCTLVLLSSSFIDYYKIPILLTGIVIYTIIYVVVNWLFVMNNYEKDIFRKPVQRVLNKFKRKS